MPETLVTDNGICFSSEDFEEFLWKNGVRHIKLAPYHPSTIGLAEQMVQTLKLGLKKMTSGSIETRVSQFLSAYWITPQTTTRLSPVKLLFNRKVRTHLDLLQLVVEKQVTQKRLQQKLNHDHAGMRNYVVGDLVYIKNFSAGPKWLPGVVVQATGPLAYLVQVGEGRHLKRHVNHIRSQTSDQQETDHQLGQPELSFLPVPSPGPPLLSSQLSPMVKQPEVARPGSRPRDFLGPQ